MAKRTWKVIGRIAPKQREIGKYDVPVEVAQLAEDIFRCVLIMELLKNIDPTNITDSNTQKQRDWADDMIQSQLAFVRSWHRYARRKLATKYLAP